MAPLPGPVARPSSPELLVWRADLDTAPLPGPGDLPGSERARAERGMTETLRHHSLVTRWAVRRVLAHHAGGDPRALVFETGAHGKPALAGAGAPQFNVTHTAGLLLVVVSAERAVGIDAEYPRERRDVLGLARHGLSDDDRALLARTPEPERQQVFLRLWVRHEAAVKCRGTGIGAAALGDRSPVTLVDAEVDDIPVAVAAAGHAPVTLRWMQLEA